MIEGAADFVVTDVQVYGGYVLHVGHLKVGEVQVGDEVTCTYDQVSNIQLMCHLATFLIALSRTADANYKSTTPQPISSTWLSAKP
jgi:alanyl-tRNA synthetase